MPIAGSSQSVLVWRGFDLIAGADIRILQAAKSGPAEWSRHEAGSKPARRDPVARHWAGAVLEWRKMHYQHRTEGRQVGVCRKELGLPARCRVPSVCTLVGVEKALEMSVSGQLPISADEAALNWALN